MIELNYQVEFMKMTSEKQKKRNLACNFLFMEVKVLK
jgi:hypothetical protein